MATSRSAMKRIRTSEKSRLRNKARVSAIKTVEKSFRAALEANDEQKAREFFVSACASLDKAVKAGSIHKNKANRKKSRLALLLNKSKKKS